MNSFSVLLTGCSVFTHEIVECLKDNNEGVDVKVVGVNCNEAQLPKACIDFAYPVPRVSEPSYVDEIIRICLLHDVKIVIPYLTCELEILASQVDKFSSKGIHLSVSPLETLCVANDKLLLHERFNRFMPKQKVLTDYTDVPDFIFKLGNGGTKPVCCKLSNKSGGQGFAVVDDVKANNISLLGRTGGKLYITTAQLEEMVLHTDNQIILQEYSEGYDYSVCLLLDQGKVLSEVGYIGYYINSGAIMQGEIMKHDEAYRIAEYVCSELKLDGNVCVDFIVNDGKAILLEINPRVNASIAFCAKAGVNLLFQRCQQLLGEKIKKVEPHYGLKMIKYYAADYYV